MRKISLDKVINLILSMYIISLYLFTYREGLFIISNGLALLFVFMVTIRIFVNNSKLVINRYLLYHLLFICICAFSVFYANNPNYAISEIKTLILIFIVMIGIINFVDTPKKIDYILKTYIIAGLLSSVYILLVSDFANITRYGKELGNQNSVGMMISISFIFSLNQYYKDNKKKYLLLPIPMFIVILLTGSRKSLLFLILTTLFIIYFQSGSNLKEKIGTIIISIIILIGVFYISTEIPIFYKIIGERIESLTALITGNGQVDTSLTTRKYMIEYGLNLFKNRPFLGYGSNNYRVMFGIIHGVERYAHNNFIELFVNIGFIGTTMYYLTNLKVAKDLLRHIRESRNKASIYPFIAIIFGYLVLGTSLVYYDSKHFSFLLTFASIIPRIYSISESVAGKTNDQLYTEAGGINTYETRNIKRFI